MPSQTNPPFNVPSGGTTSNLLDIHGNDFVGFYTPTLTSTTITFKASPSGDTAATAVNNSSASPLSFTIASNGYYGFTQDQICTFRGVRYIQCVLGSSEGAARSIPICLIPRSAF